MFAPLRFLAASCLPVCFVVVGGCLDDDNTSARPAPDSGTIGLDASLSLDDASPADGSPADAAVGSRTPITIGEGFKPGVAVDAAGTAYIAWYGPETTTNTLQFCRLSRGAKACDQRTTIAALGTTLTRPFVSVTGSTVRVVSYRYGLTGTPFDVIYIYTSADGGATFDAGRQIGTIPFNDAVSGPGDTISFATDAYTPGEVFENVSTTATMPPGQRAVLSVDHPYSGSVGFVDAATPLVVFADGSGNAQFRRYAGTGNLNVVASWSPAQNIGHGEYMHLASGPRGLFLKARSASNTLEVRKFDGATFAAGVPVPEGTGELPQSHLSQDSAGGLHLVWPSIAADGIRFYYSTSSDGVTWATARVLTSSDVIGAMRVVASPDGVAVAVWEGPSAAVRFLAVGAVAGK